MPGTTVAGVRIFSQERVDYIALIGGQRRNARIMIVRHIQSFLVEGRVSDQGFAKAMILLGCVDVSFSGQ